MEAGFTGQRVFIVDKQECLLIQAPTGRRGASGKPVLPGVKRKGGGNPPHASRCRERGRKLL